MKVPSRKSHYESPVKETFRQHFKGKRIRSIHSRGAAEVFGEERLAEGALCDEAYQTGYQASAVKSEPNEKNGLLHEKRNKGDVISADRSIR